MNPEYHICNHCKIRKTCHPTLLPIIVGRDGRAVTVGKLHKEAVFSTRCGRYTCGTDGVYVARQLMNDTENQIGFEGIELDGMVHALLGVVLGTSEKRTDINQLRIVTSIGHVYALQDDKYYFAQNVNE